MPFESRYNNLNERQKLAVDTIDGPVMVIAGPGSGKTELLSLRVANILKKTDVSPNNILCLTFTDAASKNMRDRLAGLIGVNAHKVAIHTFHSFALDTVYKFREEFYQSRQMKAADEIIQIEILGNIFNKISLSDKISAKNPDGAFIYLESAKRRIGQLKKSGITPDEYKKILQANGVDYKIIEKIFVPIFEARISKTVRDQIPKAMDELDKSETFPLPITHTSLLSYKEVFLRMLLSAYERSMEENSTKPLTEWKNKWLRRDADTKKLCLKDLYQLERNLSLAKIYEEYQKTMFDLGYIDFDDMILDAIQTLQNKKGMLAQLQEQYQYILVDEFQDTNEAQMRIIYLLSDNPVNEEKPNIMVVGDDDQAIYKFQGAEINNVLEFKKKYPKTKLITLVKNYRSTSPIVKFAQSIISQGEDRLTDRLEEIEKKLESANPDIKDSTIIAHVFDTALHEYTYIANEIKSKIANGVNPNDIAIIARNHRQLEVIAEYLQSENIPIQYERQQNILNNPHIQQLILLARLIESLSENNVYYQNDLFPTVLSFPFWDIERQTIWQLSINANETIKTKEQGRWIDAMLKSGNVQLKNIANWFLEVSSKVKTHSLEILIDDLIGPSEEKQSFTSPFRRYYFHKDQYKKNPRAYLQFLSGLSAFVHAIKLYSAKTSMPRLADMMHCVDMYEKHKRPIIDTSSYLSGTNAVTLLSAHKAKGLEFDTVFVINCQEDIWAKAQKSEMILFPKNLSIDPAGDVFDDYLRLFYVALTRAKRHLYTTSYLKKENGKDSLRVIFLEAALSKKLSPNIQSVRQNISVQSAIKILEKTVFKTIFPLAIDEKAILKPLADKYIMSVTHLNNFLNTLKGGPHFFFEQNFLRFPQAKTTSMSYGTAMHATIEAIYIYLQINKKLPALKEIKTIFQKNLERERMNKEDFKKYFAKGNNVWKIYFKTAKDRIDTSHWIETNFRTQQVMIENAHIAGKIDKIVPDEKNKTLEVYDFKTGKYHKGWKGKDQMQKIQLYEYKRQLIFYKLLIEGSRDYSSYEVNVGYLEFLSPTPKNEILLLPYKITSEDIERLKKLIIAVNAKIKKLDFPDISKYKQTLDGIIDFENDLIDGII
ncbi:ATP-dependent helicase [bacterium]|nr:MAG: ATP-dependent helicase [bacterium]